MIDDIKTPFWARHRGPWRLLAVRAPGRKGRSSSQWLRGDIRSGDDVWSEARALLNDPRDTIDLVSVWDVTDRQFVGSYRKGDDRDGDS